MISLRKYLDSASAVLDEHAEPDVAATAAEALAGYGAALMEMGNCSLEACPGLGGKLKEKLERLSGGLKSGVGRNSLAAVDREVREQLRGWGWLTAKHYREKSDEVKSLLIEMASMVESVGSRDRRCAEQIEEVTTRLTSIASLDDLTVIRSSIRKSAEELKSSIERMTAEGKAAIDQLQRQVSTYRTRLEEAEEVASRDALTGLRSRLCIESRIERRVSEKAEFCVAVVDIDGFKRVNDEYGHLAGDEVLKQFAGELVSARRSMDMIGRWGGDEFMILLECGLKEAEARVERLNKWICGNYTIQGPAGPERLKIRASIGLAEHRVGEAVKELVARADAGMYARKAASRSAAGNEGAGGARGR